MSGKDGLSEPLIDAHPTKDVEKGHGHGHGHGHGSEEFSWMRMLRLGFYFSVWYILNVVYNVYNKRSLNVVKLYWCVGTYQLLVGSVYALLIWALRVRKVPNVSREQLRRYFPIAVCHMGGHLAAVISMGFGAVSFTQLLKCGEPLFTSALSVILLRKVLKWPVYASLVPIICGVALSSVSELSFTWASFIGAMISNLTNAFRSILGKSAMTKGANTTPIGPVDLFAILTLMATCLGVPLALAVEGINLKSAYNAGMAKSTVEHPEMWFWIEATISGMAFYLYNEVAFLALEEVHPVTHAVANTLKRVAIIVITIIVFGNTITTLGIIGCSIAVTGTLLYSLAKYYCPDK